MFIVSTVVIYYNTLIKYNSKYWTFFAFNFQPITVQNNVDNSVRLELKTLLHLLSVMKTNAFTFPRSLLWPHSNFCHQVYTYLIFIFQHPIHLQINIYQTNVLDINHTKISHKNDLSSSNVCNFVFNGTVRDKKIKATKHV